MPTRWNSNISSGNRLLDALRRDCPSLRPLGRVIEPAVGTQLLAAGQPMRHVWFPTRGLVSVVAGTVAGELADAFAVGREGMVSPSVWLGVPQSPESIVLQARGALIEIASRAFCEALDSHRRVRRLLNHFTAYSLHFGYQNAACHAHHTVEQRTCSWLLRALDGTGGPVVVISQRLLAEQLGVRRQSVGLVIVGLQRAGALECRRNHIVVRDRSVLEARVCECYRLTRAHYRKVVEPLL